MKQNHNSPSHKPVVKVAKLVLEENAEFITNKTLYRNLRTVFRTVPEEVVNRSIHLAIWYYNNKNNCRRPYSEFK